MWRFILVAVASLLCSGLLVLSIPPARSEALQPVTAQDFCSDIIDTVETDLQCSVETQVCIATEFSEFWNTNGGLPIFGFPVTPARCEVSKDPSNHSTYLVQWFERERLELHPENDERFRVQLGRLGAELLARAGRDMRNPPLATPGASPPFFPETNHAIDSRFLDSWLENGLRLGAPGVTTVEQNKALFGLPVTEPKDETFPTSFGPWTGPTQWFERARYEFHTPSNDNRVGSNTVLLGLLGNEAKVFRPSGVRERLNELRTGRPVAMSLAQPASQSAPRVDDALLLNRTGQRHSNYYLLNLQQPDLRTNPTQEVRGQPGFTGSTIEERAKSAGLTGFPVAEVVTVTTRPEQAVDDLWNDPKSGPVLRDPRFTCVGVGYGEKSVPGSATPLSIVVIDLGAGNCKATIPPVPTATKTVRTCPALTNASITASVPTTTQREQITWRSTGGCAPFTGTITARFTDQRSPYATYNLSTQTGSLVDDPPNPCNRTVIYTLTLRDAGGHVTSATTSVDFICIG